MAKKKIFCVRDSKASYYMAPFLAINQGLAIRNVRAAMQSDNDVSKFPEDYSLWHLGEYDDETGKIEAIAPVHIANCIDLVQKEKTVASDLD